MDSLGRTYCQRTQIESGTSEVRIHSGSINLHVEQSHFPFSMYVILAVSVGESENSPEELLAILSSRTPCALLGDPRRPKQVSGVNTVQHVDIIV